MQTLCETMTYHRTHDPLILGSSAITFSNAVPKSKSSNSPALDAQNSYHYLPETQLFTQLIVDSQESNKSTLLTVALGTQKTVSVG